MIGDQIKSATLVGAYVVHDEYVPDPRFGPLKTPEFVVRVPVTVATIDSIQITPLWKDVSPLIDTVRTEDINYEDDRAFVCEALSEDLKSKVDRAKFILEPVQIAADEWFQVLPGKPALAYQMPDVFRQVDVLTASCPSGPWVPLASYLPLSSVVAMALVTECTLYVCAKPNLALDEGSIGRWAQNRDSYEQTCSILCANPAPAWENFDDDL